MEGKGNKGRGRGRGRGRARGQAQGQGEQDQVRRPDSGQPRPLPAPAPALPGPVPVAVPAANQWRLPPPLKDDQPLQSQVPRGQSQPASEASSRTRNRGGGSGGAASRVDEVTDDIRRMDIGVARRDPVLGEGAARGQGHNAPERTKPRLSHDDDRIITKPDNCNGKRGSTGQVTQLLVNCFHLDQSHGSSVIYQYDVEFKPPVANKEQKIGIVKSRSDIIGNISAFDGWMLFLPAVLPNDPTVFTVIKRFDNEPVEVTIRLRRELPATDPVCVQMMNVIFNRVLKMMGMERIGRDYFCPNLSIAVPQHGVEIWPGYDAKIRVFEHNTMLSIDLNHRVLRKLTVLDVMYDIKQDNRFQDKCVKEIVGQIVLTRYNNRTYRVDDIQWGQTPKSTFETRNGPVSFVDYYAKAHNADIKELGQPLLVSKLKAKDRRAGQTDDILLVPELCYMTGLSDQMVRDFRVMKDIAQHTRVDPTSRRKRLEGFSRELRSHDNAKQELANWGFGIDHQLATVQARVLPPEQISQWGENRFSYKPAEADWDRNMRGRPLTFTPPMTHWALLYPPNCGNQARDFVSTLQRVAEPMGIQLGVPEEVRLADPRNDTYVRALKATIHPRLVIIVCIVPSNQTDRYDAIKKICCIHHPVNSQVIVSRTLSKPQQLMSVCTKIALQMNCKIGGIGWTLTVPLPRTMICGMDTYHKRGSRSVGAFVASVNRTFTKYHSRSAFFNESQELHDNLRTMMTASIKKFLEKNRFLPDKIFMYRDGVGDGQLDAVFQHEVKQIQDAFKAFERPDGSPYLPSLAVIVVKKRIATRFFKQAGNQCLNPPPGTVVDDVVTNANWYDFFIISQSVRQGSVSPTHYNVIFNTMPPTMSPDRMQQLTYKLCHLYVNWPGTIRVPAPCMYAHKLAYLVGDNLKDTPSPNLQDFLFYL
ncbi:piwi-like protein 1 [Lineus longissimus]|uniref:piwi-like protein 1 n=1 Tax=Lineus longissimus TaxID=88925 RepID=UPI002B4D4522